MPSGFGFEEMSDLVEALRGFGKPVAESLGVDAEMPEVSGVGRRRKGVHTTQAAWEAARETHAVSPSGQDERERTGQRAKTRRVRKWELTRRRG